MHRRAAGVIVGMSSVAGLVLYTEMLVDFVGMEPEDSRFPWSSRSSVMRIFSPFLQT